ncbi:MAG TPA: efflux RND transporter periplasmic adaptor subunit [Blastocatellia bacterium]|nr:efflux RND transporter periplasmic adaptor subunit [Blastocatellia bacterium]
MKREQISLTTFILLCAVLSGCARTAKTAERPPTPVKVVVVQSRSTSSGSRYSASIVPSAQVEVAFKVGGYVEQILQVKGADGRLRNAQQGDTVAGGSVLARVRQKDYTVKVDQSSSQLAQARASHAATRKQIEEVKVSADKARLDFERAAALFATQSMTKSDYDAAKSQYDLLQAKVATARSQLAVIDAQIKAAEAVQQEASISKEDTVLRAPTGGILLQRAIEVGDLVSPGKTAFVVADTSTVKAVLGVPDLEVQNLKPGTTLTVELEALPGRNFTGQITAIAPSADQKTRLFEVEVSIANPARLLKVGMIASLRLVSTPTAPAAIIPLNSIVRSKDQPDQYSVFVVEDRAGKLFARLRSVTLGEAYGNGVAVNSGVKPGDRVVTSGGARLVDDEVVQVIP